MDKSEAVTYVRRFADRAVAAFPVQQIVLFGSYAAGTATEESDIDVAVVTYRQVERWLASAAELFRLREDINLAIEPVLIDSEEDPSGFLEEIRRTGEIIYDRDAERAAA